MSTTDTHEQSLTFNVNRECEVTLTEYGKDVLREHYASLGMETSDWVTRRLNGTGPQKFQLWELMRYFGKSMFMGSPGIPFEGNSVTILPDLGPARLRAIEALVAAREAGRPHWADARFIIPEEPGKYLVRLELADPKKASITMAQFHGEKGWGAIPGALSAYAITHWMPIPEYPEAERLELE